MHLSQSISSHIYIRSKYASLPQIHVPSKCIKKMDKIL
jgi:hypothetical protein